ncbi:blue copper protein, partial [Trifolium medium]|nr:blue copper protein [Trifolium medium]
ANLLHGSVSKSYIVGDSSGWIVPPNKDSQFYVHWASNKTFTVGDTLVFNFDDREDDVAMVTKSCFDDCNFETEFLRSALLSNSPARVTLNRTGKQYFICTGYTAQDYNPTVFHCSAGQKLSINVVKASAPPASAPSPTP